MQSNPKWTETGEREKKKCRELLENRIPTTAKLQIAHEIPKFQVFVCAAEWQQWLRIKRVYKRESLSLAKKIRKVSWNLGIIFLKLIFVVLFICIECFCSIRTVVFWHWRDSCILSHSNFDWNIAALRQSVYINWMLNIFRLDANSINQH